MEATLKAFCNNFTSHTGITLPSWESTILFSSPSPPPISRSKKKIRCVCTQLPAPESQTYCYICGKLSAAIIVIRGRNMNKKVASRGRDKIAKFPPPSSARTYITPLMPQRALLRTTRIKELPIPSYFFFFFWNKYLPRGRRFVAFTDIFLQKSRFTVT